MVPLRSAQKFCRHWPPPATESVDAAAQQNGQNGPGAVYMFDLYWRSMQHARPKTSGANTGTNRMHARQPNLDMTTTAK